MKNKLIIWDFDGVIADTEKLGLLNRIKLLNETCGADWDLQKAASVLLGKSDVEKRQILETYGFITNDDFWNKIVDMDMQCLTDDVVLTDGVADIFELKDFAQCIGSNAFLKETLIKIKKFGIEKYFTEKNIFAGDMVKIGKPEPELFLLAAKTMGYKPEECLVIEDSITGLTAGIRAGMNVIAFLGSDVYKNTDIEKRIRKIGVENIFYKMNDVKRYLLDNL